MEPEDSVDYPDGDWSVLGFNTWLGCGANIDGTFQDDNYPGSYHSVIYPVRAFPGKTFLHEK
jgi:hypothetical protein